MKFENYKSFSKDVGEQGVGFTMLKANLLRGAIPGPTETYFCLKIAAKHDELHDLLEHILYSGLTI
jgi:hypothetical protein